MSRLIDVFIAPGLSLLDPRMDTPEARAMLIAIGLQESRFQHRHQIGGPANGFWQFERGGIKAVLSHRATQHHVINVCSSLWISPTEDACYKAVAYNDALAAAFARLMLWWLPGRLPKGGEAQMGWNQYIQAWRPGKPHRGTWDAFFNTAWDTIRRTQ